MKKILSFFSIILLFFIFLTPKTKAYSSDLDEILSYQIFVDPRDDATLDFRYIIKWNVLACDEDGNGVTWVKIGVPNKYCTEVKSNSSDIKKAFYYVDGTSTYVRLDLVKEYMPGEIINLDFSFHQTHMFTYGNDGDTKLVTYAFTPGWFDEIKVDSLKVYWNKTNVYFSDCKSEDESDLIWSATLAKGQRTKVQVSYDEKVFPNINPKDTYKGSKDYSKMNRIVIFAAIVIVIFIILSTLSRIFRRASYYRTRGFYPYGRRFFYRYYYYGVNNKGERKSNPYVHSGGSGHSGGHSCACACACACAGGGRAGCSKKDFYKGNFDIEKFIEK